MEPWAARARRADALQRAGRHAAAERILLDVTGALVRRGAGAAAAATLVALGRLRIERGRAAEADLALGQAADHARLGGDQRLERRAQAWQAAARTDAGRLDEAERLCRGLLATDARDDPGRVHAAATLRRVLLWQGRLEEALAVSVEPTCEDVVVRVYAEAMAVRASLATGDVFGAGRCAHRLALATTSLEPIARILALTALLRVGLAVGDLEAGRRHLTEIAGLARHAHCGLRAVRARFLWSQALARAGLWPEARFEGERLRRRRKALPALLRSAIDGCDPLMAPAGSACAATTTRAWYLAGLLVSSANVASHDVEGAREVAGGARALLAARRLDLVGTPGPTVLVSAGEGMPTGLGARILETGMPHESSPGTGQEVGVPIRHDGQIAAALVAAWAPGTAAPPDARSALGAIAAVLASRVEALDRASAFPETPELVGDSAAMQALRRAIARAARAPFAVLVEGESGSGKELVARALHRLGPRRDGPFRDVNCAALPDELVESELFGHVRGAFTGAMAERAGLVEEADGGTLFLDEVVDLSARAQAKILRVIQQQEVRRVGAVAARPVDTRVVSAANRDLRAEVAAGRFRADLLYRLDVIRIRVPPLRERLEDVPALARHFWRLAARRVDSAASLDGRLIDVLCRYRWPGNVREMQNVIAGLAVSAPARGRVEPALLPAWIAEGRAEPCGRLADARVRFERQLVEAAMVRAGGQRTRAARELGISRQGLLKLMARVGLSPARDAR